MNVDTIRNLVVGFGILLVGIIFSGILKDIALTSGFDPVIASVIVIMVILASILGLAYYGKNTFDFW